MAQERERKKKVWKQQRPRDIQTCVEFYRSVCHHLSTLKSNPGKAQSVEQQALHHAGRTFQLLHKIMLQDRLDPPVLNPEIKVRLPACGICYCEWDEETVPFRFTACGHTHFCTDCVQQNISVKIKSKDVLPWMVCPVPECKYPLAVTDLLNIGLTTMEIYQWLEIHLGKLLVREPRWVSCKRKTCNYGFFIPPIQEGKGYRAQNTCQVCELRQTVEKKKAQIDDETKDMIRKGIIRSCPRCSMLTFKEKGICNVIQCSKCSIWWNWRSKETAATSKDLKAKARRKGTLWEPGELAFQQNLQRRDPKAFKALLERNGMVYDPNYVRGS